MTHRYVLKSLDDTHGITGRMQVSMAGGQGYKRTTSSGPCVHYRGPRTSMGRQTGEQGPWTSPERTWGRGSECRVLRPSERRTAQTVNVVSLVTHRTLGEPGRHAGSAAVVKRGLSRRQSELAHVSVSLPDD